MSEVYSHYYKVRRVLWITLGWNLLVAVAKITYGYMTSSLSMAADGFHSLFDGTSNLVALIGIWAASHPPDDTHHYGHRKFETFAAVGIAILLFVTCYNILRSSFTRLSDPTPPEVTPISFIIMGLTLAVNYFVMRYEQRKGREYENNLLLADSEHTRSDILASCSVLISLIAVKLNYPVLDPIAALFIAVLIGRVGIQILLESSKVLSDYSVLEPKILRELAMKVDGVEECHQIRTRGSSNHIYIDLHIHVPPEMTTLKAHEVAHRVEATIKDQFPEVVDIVVHVEPHIPNLEND
ncbi:MAG TPA: cation diffusion facilitator family transporter [Nitrospiria bacterium]|jgi:cation diffusion facilitator family transporter